MKKPEYKVGDWLKNKHTGQLVEIVHVNRTSDGVHMYTINKLDNEYRLRLGQFFSNYTSLQEFYEPAPVAQLLYRSNSNK